MGRLPDNGTEKGLELPAGASRIDVGAFAFPMGGVEGRFVKGLMGEPCATELLPLLMGGVEGRFLLLVGGVEGRFPKGLGLGDKLNANDKGDEGTSEEPDKAS